MPTARDILARKGSTMVSTEPEGTVDSTIRKMVGANVHSAVVVDNGDIVGMFTERDLLFQVVGQGKNAQTTPVGEVMSSPAPRCDANDDVRHCAEVLLGRDVRHLVVTDTSGPVGLIGLRDVLREDLTSEIEDDSLISGAILFQSLQFV